MKSQFYKSIRTAFVVALTLAGVVAASAAPSGQAPRMAPTPASTLGTSIFKPGLFYHQTINFSNEVLIHAKVGDVASADQFDLSSNVVTVQGAPIAVLPRVEISGVMTLAAAKQQVKTWFSYVPNGFTRSMGSWLSARGISHGTFSFSQDVNIRMESGLIKKQIIAWTGFVDNTGKGNYGAPQIVDPDPTFVEAQYTSKSADTMLPSNWHYEGAGMLRYRVLDMRGAVVQGWREIDTAGAFDESEADMGDDSHAVRCLVDRSGETGCAPMTNLRDVMESTGSGAALLRYVRQLEPVYEPSTDPAAGPDEFEPVRVYSYEDRLMTCEILQNTGNFGYLLQATSTIYAVNESEPRYVHQRIAEEDIEAISPVDAFDHTVPIGAIGSMHPAEALISPFDGSTIWHIDSKEGRAALSIAPIRTEISGKTSISGLAGGAEVITDDLGSGIKQFKIGKPFWCPGIDRACNSLWGGLYRYTASLNITEVDRLEEFTLVQSEFDDRAMIEVNGHLMYIGPARYSLAVDKGWAVGETGYSLGSGTFSKKGCDSGESGGCYTQTIQAVYFGKTSAPMPGVCGEVYGVPGTIPCWDWLDRGVAVSGFRDLKKKFYVTHNIDLRPWLHEGVNTFTISLIVADTGGGALTLRERRTPSCGASFGIDEADKPALGQSVSGLVEQLEYLGRYR